MQALIYTAICLVAAVGCTNRQRDTVPTEVPDTATFQAADTPTTEAGKPASTTLIVDVRSPSEYANGHIEGAINIPHTEIGEKIENHAENKSQKTVLYCAAGVRAGKALVTLEELGYTDVENLGGYEEAKKKIE